MSKEYKDIMYCGHCGEDTEQTIFDSEHERDSSNDRQECHKCGWVRYGLSGTWEPPYDGTIQQKSTMNYNGWNDRRGGMGKTDRKEKAIIKGNRLIAEF